MGVSRMNFDKHTLLGLSVANKRIVVVMPDTFTEHVKTGIVVLPIYWTWMSRNG